MDVGKRTSGNWFESRGKPQRKKMYCGEEKLLSSTKEKDGLGGGGRLRDMKKGRWESRLKALGGLPPRGGAKEKMIFCRHRKFVPKATP